LNIACQTLKGVISKESRKWFDMACTEVDIIGGLPASDPGYEKQHLDIILHTAKEQNKPLHVHVDQLDKMQESESQLLAERVIAYNMENKVLGIHGISIAAHQKQHREYLYNLFLDAGLGFISCPTAWLDRQRREDLLPVHNSITPIDEMIPKNIPIFIGSDNICDIYKPYSDGNMYVELRCLLESTHFYDFDALVRVSTFNSEYNRYFAFK
jgi:cytosine/creatinine deaminase